MPESFQDIVTAAVSDIAEHGFDSAERVQQWMERLARAAEGSLVPESVLNESLRQVLRATYDKQVERGGIMRTNPGVSRFTLERVKPELRRELDRRILASASLIKLNRQQAIASTLHRFSGWATSVPIGGAPPGQKADAKRNIRKALAQLPFQERRVLIDQGHKLTASINYVVASGGGAIAARWHSRWRQAGYDYREPHKDRDGKVYAVRGSWALEQGLMWKGPNGYTDGQTMPGEEVFCRCSYVYLYNLRDLPDEMLTVKGRKELARVRVA